MSSFFRSLPHHQQFTESGSLSENQKQLSEMSGSPEKKESLLTPRLLQNVFVPVHTIKPSEFIRRNSCVTLCVTVLFSYWCFSPYDFSVTCLFTSEFTVQITVILIFFVGNLEPITVYDHGGVHVSLHFARDSPLGYPGVAVVVSSTVNTSALQVKDFLFQAAVPKVENIIS